MKDQNPIRFVSSDSHRELDYLQMAQDMLQLASNEVGAGNSVIIDFFLRKAEIAALISIAQSKTPTSPSHGPKGHVGPGPCPEGKQETTTWELSANMWAETAQQYAKDAAYYRGLVERIGKVFGKEAYTADDGTVGDSVLCVKVPELVENLDKQIKILASSLG